MQGRTAQRAAREIETVMDRFQAWTGSPDPAAALAATQDGVREISYEQALESSRDRRPPTAETPTAGAVAEAPSAAVAAHSAPASPPRSQSRLQNSSPATPKSVSPANGSMTGTARAPKPKRVSHANGSVSASAPRQKKRVSQRGRAPANGKLAASPPAVAQKRKPSRSQQQFRALLAQSAAIAASGNQVARGLYSEDRQTSMAMRFDALEQALIGVRATEAGIPISAYLRQCALDVETLRAQLQQFTVMERSHPAEAASPVVSPARSESAFARLLRRIWEA